MEEKVYVCTVYNRNSIGSLLGEIEKCSSVTWNEGAPIRNYVPDNAHGYLFIEWNDYYEEYYLMYSIEMHGAKLVTPNEFKRIAAKLCPKENK